MAHHKYPTVYVRAGPALPVAWRLHCSALVVAAAAALVATGSSSRHSACIAKSPQRAWACDAIVGRGASCCVSESVCKCIYVRLLMGFFAPRNVRALRTLQTHTHTHTRDRAHVAWHHRAWRVVSASLCAPNASDLTQARPHNAPPLQSVLLLLRARATAAAADVHTRQRMNGDV